MKILNYLIDHYNVCCRNSSRFSSVGLASNSITSFSFTKIIVGYPSIFFLNLLEISSISFSCLSPSYALKTTEYLLITLRSYFSFSWSQIGRTFLEYGHQVA